MGKTKISQIVSVSAADEMHRARAGEKLALEEKDGGVANRIAEVSGNVSRQNGIVRKRKPDVLGIEPGADDDGDHESFVFVEALRGISGTSCTETIFACGEI